MPSQHTKKRVALVTGAASGLGACFADNLARGQFDLVLVDWNADLLQESAGKLRRHGGEVRIITQDLTQPEAVKNIRAQCDTLGLTVDFLVNNAGYHLNKLMHEMTWPVIENNLQVLLNVVVEMTHQFLPGMIERNWGRIINVSSVSGFMPGGIRLATYNSTKTFIIPFTEALNFETAGTGVQVTAVCPGFMRTNLFKNSDLMDVRSTVPGFMWLNPEDVARESIHCVEQNKPVYVAGWINRAIVLTAKFVPRQLLRERTRIFHRATHKRMASVSSVNSESGNKKVALVTGATAGIGASFCAVLAEKGYNLILVSRREDLLRQKASELGERYGIETQIIAQDLTDPHAVDAICSRLIEIGWQVDVLINNAGFPANDVFHEMSWTEVKAVLQIYIKSVVKLTHALVPGMISRGWGRVANISSMAAFEPGSYRSSLYTSSKAFQLAISESLSAELEGTGVSVSAVCPGFTKTEWMSKSKVETGSLPDFFWMSSDAVAQVGFEVINRGSPVCVVATPALRLISAIFQVAPRRWVGYLLSRKRRAMTKQTAKGN
jgi:short-subunit dehydrogenase